MLSAGDLEEDLLIRTADEDSAAEEGLAGEH